MNEKKLLYGALAATAIAATFGVLRAREPASRSQIAPVSLLDSSRTLSSAEIPIRLTSSDGTGLALVSLRAAAVLEDPLALTEMELAFENPEDRVLEGTFRIALPQGASVSRFAMKIGDVWQEGEVVEKQKARQTYEDFLHRRQDPALMEQGAGNEFTARVFPIPARGVKNIKIAYSEVVEASAPYVLPLRGLPMLGALDVDVHAVGSKSDATFGLHQTQFTPGADFVVDAPKLPRSPGLRAGDVAMARVVPFATSRPDPMSSAIFLVDTSASRALGLTEEASLVRQTIARLAPDTSIVVACFDQEVVEVYRGKASGFGESEAKAILARGALGASDVEQALAWAGENAKKAGAKRIVIVSDGVATAGETDSQKLKAKVEQLRPAGIERIDAVAMGGIRDDAFLRGVVRGVLDRDGTILDAKLGADAIARRLAEGTSSAIPVKVEGATWSWPKTLDGLQAGDEVVVYASIAPDKPFRVVIGTQEFAPDLRTIDKPLVERAWAQAKIQSLVEAPTADPATTKREIVQLSTRHRVLSPHTALLVLETDWDYRRYGIERNATVDILSVRDGRVALVSSTRREDVSKPRTVTVQTGRKGGENDRNGKDKIDDVTSEAPKTAAADPAPPRGNAVATATAPPVVTMPPTVTGGAPQGGKQGGRRPGLAALDDEDPHASADEKAEAKNRPTARPFQAPREEPAPTTPAPTRGLAQRSGEGWDRPAPEPAASAAPHRDFRTPPPPPPPPPQVERRLDQNQHDVATGSVRATTLVVDHGIAQGEALRVTRQGVPQLRACYTNALRTDRSLHGRFVARLVVDELGAVKAVTITEGPANEALRSCATRELRAMRFPAPGTGDAVLTAGFELVPDQGSGSETDVAENVPPATKPDALPYEGRLQIVMEHLARGEKDAAFDEANKWRAEEPGDVLALVALGEALEAKGEIKTAARAYGSILELYSFRADSRRFAGERLERLGDPGALRLAIDTYAKAAEQRGDHPASHRLHAFALLKGGQHEKAFDVLAAGLKRSYPAGRFAGYDRILREDLGLAAAAWSKAQPQRTAEIRTKLRQAGGNEENAPSVRFVLNWETDANDVDFHIYDAKGGHAFYSHKTLESGGELYADVTTGYGPECFTIRGPKEKRSYPYTLQAHYYSRGPMGYGMGKLEIVEHDGHGNLTFDERPFVVMKDRAYVDLGKVEKNKSAATASLR